MARRPRPATSIVSLVRATLPENADAERNAFSMRQICRSGFGFDLNFFGRVIEHADADVVEIEVLLDLVDDLAPASVQRPGWKSPSSRCC